MALFSILVDLAARTSNLEQGLERSRRSIDRFADDARKAIKAVTFAAAANQVIALGKAAFAAAQQQAELNEKIVDGATKAGAAVGQFSALAVAADKSGVSSEQLSSAVTKLQLKLVAAARGSEESALAFKRLGLEAQALRQLDLQSRVEQIADAIGLIADPASQAAAAVAVFGEAGAQLLPFLLEGSAGLRDVTEKAIAFNAVVTEQTAQATKAAGDAFDTFGLAATGLKNKLLVVLAPALEATAGLLERIAGVTPSDLDKQLDSLVEKQQRLQKNVSVFRNLFGNKEGLLANAASIEELRKKIAERESGKPIEIELPARLKLNFLPISVDPINKAFDQDTAAGRFDDMAAKVRESLEAERAILEQASAEIAQAQVEIFQSNEQEIQQFLDRTIEETAAKLEQQASVFDELRGTLESSISDAFLNAGNGARGFADSVLGAFKRILADRAAAQVVELIGGLFGAKKDPGVGGGAGLFATALGSLFGGARAKGGPVSPGKAFLVGENGPELFAPGLSGRIIPNGAGGSVMVNMPVNIDARGSTQDSMKVLMAQLPAILRSNNQSLKASLNEDLRRGRPQFT